MGRRVRIVTDSVADIPREIAQRLDIAVVPVYLIVDGESYLADAELDQDWFYELVMQAGAMPKTAAPPSEMFLSTFSSLVEEGAEEIIGLFVANKLSSLAEHAHSAAQRLTEAKVHFVDTAQISMGIGWLVIAAAEAAAQGASVAEIIRLVEGMRPRTYVLGVLNSLEHLRRGGRVGWLTAQVIDLLQIKPMLSFYEGEAKLVARMRTRQRALRALVAAVAEACPLERLAILHSRAEPAALQQLSAQLMPYASQSPIPTVEVGPIFGTHVGPQGLGVALVRSLSNLDM